MNQTLVDMVTFVGSGTANSPEIRSAIAEIGRQPFRVVAIKILSWLKSQKLMENPRPLVLNGDYEWSRNILHLIKKQAFLSGVIRAGTGSLELLPDLRNEDVKNLLDFVDAGYQPRLMADPRR